MKTNTGGTAFPMQDAGAIHAYALARTPESGTTEERDRAYTAAKAEAVGGMTLRDYFAAKVCAAMLTSTSADNDFPNTEYRQQPDGPTVAERIASTSYAMADAMIKARNQGEPHD